MPSLTADFLQNRKDRGRFRVFVISAVLILGALALILGGVFAYQRISGRSSGPTEAARVLPEAWLLKYFGTADEFDGKVGGPFGDADGDILTNQQEYLFGTDPTRQDTDGDGALDGVEVAFGQNPTGEGEWQLTAQARNFVDSLLSARPELKEFSRERVLGQVQELFQPDREVVLDLPADAELKIVSDNDPKSLERYFEETKALKSAEEYEIQDIVARLFGGMSEGELNFYIQKLGATEAVLKQTPVPSALVQIHKYKIAELRAGVRMFELVRDNYRPDQTSQQFWADVFYQITAAQQAGLLELASWQEIGQQLQDTGGLAELDN